MRTRRSSPEPGVVPIPGLAEARASAAIPRVRVHLPDLPAGWRAALAVIGTVNLLIGLPMLFAFAPWGGVSAPHLARDGVIACVIGGVVVGIAIRPRWCRPLTVVAALAFLLQMLGGAVDLAGNRVHVGFELVHLVGAAAVVVAALALLRVRARIESRELDGPSVASPRDET